MMKTLFKDEGAGSAGDLSIVASAVLFHDGAYISSNTEGKGKGGEINIFVNNTVLFSGEDSKNRSGIYLTAIQEGDAGLLNIKANNISFTEGAIINSLTYGKGKGGNIKFNIYDNVFFKGESNYISRIDISTKFNEIDAGDGGSISIKAKNITFADGTFINSSTYGKGKGGNIILIADSDILFYGEDSNQFGSSIYMYTDNEEEGAGDAGNLNIKAKNLTFMDGAIINSTTYGKGNGGKINMDIEDSIIFFDKSSVDVCSSILLSTELQEVGAGNAGKLNLNAGNIYFMDGGSIRSSTSGNGDGGEVSIIAKEDIYFGGYNNNIYLSHIDMKSVNEGDGGSLSLKANYITFTDGAYINSNTTGKGNGGKINLFAFNNIEFFGEAGDGIGSIILLSTSNKSNGAGNAGELSIKANNVTFINGAYIDSNTTGTGKGGEIDIVVNDSVFFEGESSDGNESSIKISTEHEGNAGNLYIQSNNMEFLNGAYLDSKSIGKGKGGEIHILAKDNVLFEGESSSGNESNIVLSTNNEGDAGTLNIEANNLKLLSGAYIDSSTSGQGKGGNINLNILNSAVIEGESKNGNCSRINMFTNSTEENAGNAGGFNIKANNISFLEGAYINSITYGKGNGGEINFSAKNNVLFNGEDSKSMGSLVLMQTEGDGDAGKLNIKANNVSFINGAYIDSETKAKGKGGEINILANDSVLFAYESSNGEFSSIRISTYDIADAGKLNIESQNIKFIDGAYIDSATYGKGKGGEINLNANDSVLFEGKSKYGDFVSGIDNATKYSSEGSGDGGSLNIKANNIIFNNGAKIFSNTDGKGKGGEINLLAKNLIQFKGENSARIGSSIEMLSTCEENDSGNAGKLNIESQNVLFTDGAYINSDTFGKGNGGEIHIFARDSILFNDKSSDGTSSYISVATYYNKIGAGDAGKLSIKANNISFLDGTNISSGTDGMGMGGSVHIKAVNNIVFSQNNNTGNIDSVLLATNYKNEGAGASGELFMDADNISLLNGASINSKTYGKGNVRQIKLYANNELIISGYDSKGNSSQIVAGVDKESTGGNSGQILIRSEKTHLLDSANISTSSEGIGNAGNIILNVNTLKLDDISSITSESNNIGKAGLIGIGKISNVNNENDLFTYNNSCDTILLDNNSYISTSSNGENASEAGNIEIASKNLTLQNNSYISSSTESNNNAGNINISANDLSLNNFSQISTISKSKGSAGNINIGVSNLNLDNMSSLTSSSNAQNSGGNAGTILIGGEIIQLNDEKVSISKPCNNIFINNSNITTEAQSSGGGKIELKSDNRIYAKKSTITTNVKDGSGKGGDINISSNELLLQKSNITANAIEGDGGAVYISAEQFIKSSNSSLQASSERGNDGTVEIDAPNVNFNEGLANFDINYLNADKWMKTPCVERTGGNVSRLIVENRDAIPGAIDDLMPSPPIDLQIDFTEQVNIFSNKLLQSNICNLKKNKDLTNDEIENMTGLWEAAINQLNDKTNLDLYCVILERLSFYFQSTGFHRKALYFFEKALPVFEKDKKYSRKAYFYNCFSDLCLSLGFIENAVKYNNKAEIYAKSYNKPVSCSKVLNNKGNTLIAQKKYELALITYNKSFNLIKDIKTCNNLKAIIMINSIFAQLLLKQYNAAIISLDNAIHYVSSLDDSPEKANYLISLSLKAFELERLYPDKHKNMLQISFNLLKQAKQIGNKFNNYKILSKAFGYIGHLYELAGEQQKAINKTRKAIFFAGQDYLPEILYLWQWQLGRLFKATNNEHKAIKSYEDSIQTLSKIRTELFTGYRFSNDFFEQNVKPVYQGLAGLFLNQADYSKNLQTKEIKLLAARNVMESLKKSELEDFFEDECVGRNKNLNNSFHRTSKGIALLYPIALPDRLVILLTLPDKIVHYNTRIKYKDLNLKVRNYRKQLESRVSYKFLKNAKSLYKMLIKPIEEELKLSKINTLLVAPDGALRLFPFASLHDGKHFLIEKFAIVTIPAISLVDLRPYNNHNQNILLNGLSESVQNFSPLPNVKDELYSIKKIMNSENIFINKSYTISNITNELMANNYDIIHFATHGLFAGTAKDSYLLTYDSKLNMNILHQLMSYSKYRSQSVELLTLSACQTALGDERAALGLAGIAVKAGVKSAIATLWFIDDKATSHTVKEFYQQLKRPNITRAKALQNAQKKMISSSRYKHPVYWAPFLLIGSWG